MKLAIILAILVGGRRRREVDEGEDELKKRRLCMIYGRVAWELEKAPIAIGRSPRIFWHSTWQKYRILLAREENHACMISSYLVNMESPKLTKLHRPFGHTLFKLGTDVVNNLS